MKSPTWIALVACAGLGATPIAGAAQQDEAQEVLKSYREMLEGREGVDPEILAEISELIAEQTTDPGALTDVFRQLHPEFAAALEAAADPDSDAGIAALRELSESDNPFLAAEASYYLGRNLMARLKFEEALPVFIAIQDDYFDQSLRVGEAIFYQGLCESNTLQRDAASISLNDFIDLYPDAPARLLAEANDIIASIENVLDGSIEDVADHMDFATMKLELTDTGERTQEVHGDIIAMLDDLIDQAENAPP